MKGIIIGLWLLLLQVVELSLFSSVTFTRNAVSAVGGSTVVVTGSAQKSSCNCCYHSWSYKFCRQQIVTEVLFLLMAFLAEV